MPSRRPTGPRRRALVESLVKLGVADAANRVVVGYPIAEGLYGDEARQIYSRAYLSQSNATSFGFTNNGSGNFEDSAGRALLPEPV